MFRVLVLGLVSILSACAANKGTVNSFYEPSYMAGEIKSLAVPAIRNARLAPAESQQIGRTLNKAIIRKNPSLKIVTANGFSKIVNDLSAVDDYSDFIKDYVTSGVANQEFLRQLEENGIDAIMIGEISRINHSEGTFGNRKASTRVSISFTIISTKSANVVWSATAEGLKGVADTISDAPPVIEAINLAVGAVEDVVPVL